MTFPAGSSFDPTNYGVGATGGVSGMKNRTQGNVETELKSTVGDGRWGQIDGGIFAILAAAIAAILGGFGTVLDAIFGTVNNHYIEQMPIITDHTQQLEDLAEQFNQLILQGNAIVFVDNDTYVPTPGILSIDVILIGAGGGGGGGRTDLIGTNRGGGGGGGGGGEVHTSIPANLLPQTNGVFDPIIVGIGAGGSGGAGSQQPGHGGGNTTFGAFLAAGGGDGGFGNIGSTAALGGRGGAGMIAGGTGGTGGGVNGAPVTATAGGNSSSAYDLHGGGGGGGGGTGFTSIAKAGGTGGISPGGEINEDGTPPSPIIATGGGGGGGGNEDTPGNGAYPAGGGGGGAAAPLGSDWAIGGNGGNGICYVIERFT